MGGGFWWQGKPAGAFACVAALLARKTRRPVKLRVDRDDDMMITGKRHDFVTEYEAGFDDDGRILGVDSCWPDAAAIRRPLRIDQRSRDAPQR